jgi:hypothetical protein
LPAFLSAVAIATVAACLSIRQSRERLLLATLLENLMETAFWISVWVMMALAFTTAWAFIVKGCEAMDVANAAVEEEAAQ